MKDQTRQQGLPKSIFLITATEAVTTVEMDEDELDVMETVESSHQSPETMAAQESFLHAMKTVCCVQSKVFQNVHKTHKLEHDDNLGESIDLLLFNPPHNVYLQQDLKNSKHDVSISKNMVAISDICGICFEAWRTWKCLRFRPTVNRRVAVFFAPARKRWRTVLRKQRCLRWCR